MGNGRWEIKWEIGNHFTSDFLKMGNGKLKNPEKKWDSSLGKTTSHFYGRAFSFFVDQLVILYNYFLGKGINLKKL